MITPSILVLYKEQVNHFLPLNVIMVNYHNKKADHKMIDFHHIAFNSPNVHLCLEPSNDHYEDELFEFFQMLF